MTWLLPDTYHLGGHGREPVILKLYEGRDILSLPLVFMLRRTLS